MNNLITRRNQSQDMEIIHIIETYLENRLNDSQQFIMKRLMDAEHGYLVSIPLPRRAGKTTLANALMMAIRDAICVIPNQFMLNNYAPELLTRIYSSEPDLTDRQPSLVIFDEVTNISYIKRIQERLHNSKILRMYTPNENLMTSYRENEPFRSRRYNEAISPWETDPGVPPLSSRAEYDREQRRLAIGRYTFDEFDFEQPKQKDKKWDEAENN